jgi:hypothetical protein
MVAQSLMLMIVIGITRSGFRQVTTGMPAEVLNSPAFSVVESMMGVVNVLVILPMIYGVFLFVTGN